MDFKRSAYPETKLYNFIMKEFDKRGVTKDDIVDIAIQLQAKYNPDVPREDYFKVLEVILHKIAVMNSLAVGLTLDNLATEDKLPEPLQTIIQEDSSYFDIDEYLAISISNLYGAIGITNFGFLDKCKTGIVKQLDESADRVNTFADDLVGALAVAVGAKISFDNHLGF